MIKRQELSRHAEGLAAGVVEVAVEMGDLTLQLVGQAQIVVDHCRPALCVLAHGRIHIAGIEGV